jgi:hypothetical protein
MEKLTFADKAIDFARKLEYTGSPLPNGIRIMNPFKENPGVLAITETFYKKFYNDYHQRKLILGINPSRLGAGLTGIPLTDPKKLVSECGIAYQGKITHEPSSTFIYEMIKAYGGAQSFYRNFYINSPCPLGFTQLDEKGNERNYNYYDSIALFKAVESYMVDSLSKLIALGIRTDICYCLGIGKNEQFLTKLNNQHRFFDQIIALEHPRFIMQYKSIDKQNYIDKYLCILNDA